MSYNFNSYFSIAIVERKYDSGNSIVIKSWYFNQTHKVHL